MKDSGVQWLGQVPEGWSVRRLKQLSSSPFLYGANEAADAANLEHPRFIRITDIETDGTLRDETFRSLPPDVAAPYMLKDGDVLFARSGATVGKTFIYKTSWGPACFAGYLIKFSASNNILLPTFLKYFTETEQYWGWLNSIFIKSTIQNVSAEKYAELLVPLPSIEIQKAVSAYLDIQTAKLDALRQKMKQSVEKLSEYRTSLISAAVTGKIDVRGEVPD